jgi:kynureninase
LYFFPVVTSQKRSFHPLMAWWAVLHTLSMLARYQPAEWASYINVDTSQYAVAIERLLKAAIRVLPQLVAETIDRVAR